MKKLWQRKLIELNVCCVICRGRSPPPRRGRSRSPSRVRHRSSLSRSKSRSRSRSPRSPPRHAGRYKCEPPKYPPYAPVRTLPDVSKRYDDMYIPPEFCRVAASWLASMPDHQPLSLLKPIQFEVQKVKPSVPAECADVVLHVLLPVIFRLLCVLTLQHVGCFRSCGKLSHSDTLSLT